MILNFKINHQILIGLLLIFCLTIMLFPSVAFAGDINSGAKIFEMNCAGCHANGGNIVRRGKTLKKRALKRNGFDSITAIDQIVTQGKGNMSAYGDRLTTEEIKAVSNYVWQQAEKGWKK
jgi:cytochrome c6